MVTAHALSGLTPADAQHVFRTTLAAISRPGSIHRLEPVSVAAELPPAALPPLAIADVETAVHVTGGEEDRRADTAALFRRSTGARIAPDCPSADIVVALGEPAGDDVAALRPGTAESPEQGTRVFIGCRTLVAIERRATASAHTGIWLVGPGASSGRGVRVEGVSPSFFEAVGAINRGGPTGIDCWLVADDRSVCAIPRSSTVHLIASVD